MLLTHRWAHRFKPACSWHPCVLIEVPMLVLQLQGPNITPFTVEKENLILGLWQLQQAGQDFRIKEVSLPCPQEEPSHALGKSPVMF